LFFLVGEPGHQFRRVEMKSKVDQHPDRPAIEAALARRVALRKIGKRYGLTIDSLFRHKRKLLREAPEMFIATQARDWGKVSAEELEALRLETSEGWLRNVRADLGKVLFYRDYCISENNHEAAATWTGHAVRYFKLIGEAAAQLQAHSINVTNNFFQSPDFWLFQNTIIAALADHPEARADVLRVLEGIGSGAAPPMITVSPVQHEVAA
jgi:hypothetical protein